MADLGTDINMPGGLDPMFALVSGNLALGQSLAGRLQSPRGSYSWDPSAGTDIRAYLEGSFDASKTASLVSDIQNECRKDERVQSAAASVVFNTSSNTLTVTIQITTASGPFVLVLAVTSLTVSLLTVQ